MAKYDDYYIEKFIKVFDEHPMLLAWAASVQLGSHAYLKAKKRMHEHPEINQNHTDALKSAEALDDLMAIPVTAARRLFEEEQ